MRVGWKEKNTYTLDQSAANDEMLEKNGLTESNGIKLPVGEASNDHETEPMYLLAKCG